MSRPSVKINRELVRAAVARSPRTQRDIAESIGIGYQHLSDIINGRRNTSMETARELAVAIGVELEDILAGGLPSDYMILTDLIGPWEKLTIADRMMVVRITQALAKETGNG